MEEHRTSKVQNQSLEGLYIRSKSKEVLRVIDLRQFINILMQQAFTEHLPCAWH